MVGAVLWVSVLKSGVHATLAGVALAFMIPLEITDGRERSTSLAKPFEHDLQLGRVSDIAAVCVC